MGAVTESKIEIALKRDFPAEPISENLLDLLKIARDPSFKGIPWQLRSHLKNGRKLFGTAVGNNQYTTPEEERGQCSRALGQLLPIRDFLIKKFDLTSIEQKADEIAGKAIGHIYYQPDMASAVRAYHRGFDMIANKIAKEVNGLNLAVRNKARVVEIFTKVAMLDLVQQTPVSVHDMKRAYS